jgi:hypothetical protein
MPNWCYNLAIIYHDEKLEIDLFQDSDFLSIKNVNYKERLDENCILLRFDSAWQPPISSYSNLESMNFEIEAYYYEPTMNFCGKYETNTENSFFDLSKMSIEDRINIIPSNITDEYPDILQPESD